MNSDESENYLLVKRNASGAEELFKLALACAEKSHNVLYISPKPLKKLPTIENPDKDILKRIIFMYFADINQLISKLLELHAWTISPALVIIDSLMEFHPTDPNDSEIVKYTLAVSTLFNCMQYLKRKLNRDCLSIVSVDADTPTVHLKILCDLYYYKSSISSVDSLFSKI